MILIAIGSNLPFPPYNTPLEVCEAALGRLAEEGIELIQKSRWFESAPVPPSDQPWFVNGVLEVSTNLGPDELLDRLHAVERAFGRERGALNAARTLDLDLLAYGELVWERASGLILPHCVQRPLAGRRARAYNAPLIHTRPMIRRSANGPRYR